MPVRKVFVGVDGSKNAEAALNAAIEEAKLHNVQLEILNIRTVPIADKEMLEKKESIMMEALLSQYKEKAMKAGVASVNSRMIMVPSTIIKSSENPIGAALVSEAEKECCDMLVIGTRGHGGLTRAVLGSVADYTIRKHPCNIYVVKC